MWRQTWFSGRIRRSGFGHFEKSQQKSWYFIRFVYANESQTCWWVSHENMFSAVGIQITQSLSFLIIILSYLINICMKSETVSFSTQVCSFIYFFNKLRLKKCLKIIIKKKKFKGRRSKKFKNFSWTSLILGKSGFNSLDALFLYQGIFKQLISIFVLFYL